MKDFKIEDRGQGWRVYATILDGEYERESIVFVPWAGTPYNPFNSRAVYGALAQCSTYVRYMESKDVSE